MAHFSCSGSMNEVVEEYGGAKPTMSRCYVIYLVMQWGQIICVWCFGRFVLFLLIYLLILN